MGATRAPRAHVTSPDRKNARTVATRRTQRRLGPMTWRDVRAALDEGHDRVVVPFGAVEQHGSHLPLETDALLGDRLGPLLAERLDALCAPTVPIGCSEYHMGRAGTLSLRPTTLHLVVRDLVESLAYHGFRTIVLLATHGGNAAPLAHAARMLEPPSGVRIVAVPDIDALGRALHAASNGGGLPLEQAFAHAGEIETSLVLALAPDALRARSDEAGGGGDERERPLEQAGTASPAGSGDAGRATEAAGRSYVAAFLAECLRQLEAQGITPCACP
jgi:creatinine amidohydrolase